MYYTTMQNLDRLYNPTVELLKRGVDYTPSLDGLVYHIMPNSSDWDRQRQRDDNDRAIKKENAKRERDNERKPYHKQKPPVGDDGSWSPKKR